MLAEHQRPETMRLSSVASNRLEAIRLFFSNGVQTLFASLKSVGLSDDIPIAESDFALDKIVLTRRQPPAELFYVEPTTEELYLDLSFFEYVCARSHYDLLSALIICQLVKTGLHNRGIPDLTVTHILSQISITLAGRSVVSQDASRIEDVCLLFVAETGQQALDSRVRVLFAYELLLGGEVLSLASYSNWLLAKFGPLCSLLNESQRREDLEKVSAYEGVISDGTLSSVRISDLAPGMQYQVNRLVALLEQRQLALFLGAGVSKAAPSFAPTWIVFRDACFEALLNKLAEEQLLTNDQMINYSRSIKDSTMKPEVIMDLIHQVVGDRLFETLSVLASGTYNLNHRFVASAFGQGLLRNVLTTNFDTYVEEACSAASVPFRVMSDDDEFDRVAPKRESAELPACIWKLHGTLIKWQSIVMTLNGAAKPLSSVKRQLLAHILSTGAVLFLGYSGYDNDIYPVLMALRNKAREIFWCFRPYGRTENIEHLLAAYADRCTHFELNLDRLLLELSRGLRFEAAAGLQFYQSVQDIDLSDFFRRWSQAVSSAEALDIVGGMLLHVGQKNDAKALFVRQQQHATSADDRRRSFSALCHLGDIGLAEGAFTDAESIYREGLRHLDSDLKTHANSPLPEHNRTHLKIGDTYLKRLRFNMAETIYTQTLELCEAVDDRPNIAAAEARLGDLFLWRGKPRTALLCFRRALAKFRLLGEILSMATCYCKIGGIFFIEGRSGRALENLMKGLKIWEETNDLAGMAAAYQNLGLIYSTQGKEKLAQAHYQKALDIFTRLEAHEEWEQCSLDLAHMHSHRGELNQAARVYGLMHIHFNSLDVRQVESTRGKIGLNGPYRRKATHYNRMYLDLTAKIIAQQKKVVTSKPSYYERFAYVKEQATDHLKREIERYQRIVNGQQNAENLDEVADAHFFLAGDFQSEGDYPKALYHARQCLELYERVGRFSNDYEREQFQKWLDLIADKCRPTEDAAEVDASEAEPSFNERADFEFERANTEMQGVRERFQRIVDGKERARDLNEIAEAHFFLVDGYRWRNDYKRALYHARQSFQLNEQLGNLDSDYERERFIKWIETIEEESKA